MEEDDLVKYLHKYRQQTLVSECDWGVDHNHIMLQLNIIILLTNHHNSPNELVFTIRKLQLSPEQSMTRRNGN